MNHAPAAYLPPVTDTARWLGNAGLLPFGFGVLLVWVGLAPELHDFVTFAMSAYAGLIVAFLGGIHWGLAFRNTAPAASLFVWGVVPSLLAWVAVLMPPRAGLVLRAVGESPESAHALGYPVRTIRFAAVVTGGALCGVAGACLSVVYAPMWVEGLVAGRGWIALALTTFATWRPGRVLVGAWLFGGVTLLQFHLQAQGVAIASQLLAMLPYLATIVVLALISRNPAWIRANMPASLGRPFHAG
jgi:simple sugar transport system permease protein